MAFDWAEYLILAEDLVIRADTEAAARSAISRASYAALGVAASHLRRNGIDVPVFTTHAFVWRASKHSADHRRVTVGMDLDLLRQRREAADYQSESPGDLSGDARDAVWGVGKILLAIAGLHASPA